MPSRSDRKAPGLCRLVPRAPRPEAGTGQLRRSIAEARLRTALSANSALRQREGALEPRRKAGAPRSISRSQAEA